jgi:myo-inositol-1-phosphate synthase
MKSPQNQRPDDEAREATEKFIAKYQGKKSPGTRPKGRTAPKKRAAATKA